MKKTMNIINYKSNKNITFLSSKEVIIFDLNGTIIDTTKSTMMGYLDTFKYYYGSFEKMPKILKSQKLLKSFLGKPFIYSLKDKLKMDDKTAEDLNNYYLNAVKKYAHYDELYPNIKYTLEKLYEEGKTLCIATQKLKKQVDIYLEKFKIGKYFTYIACRNTAEETYTKDELLVKVINKLNVTSKECIFVGDMISDYIGAVNNKLEFVGIISKCGNLQNILYEVQSTFNIYNVIDKVRNIMCSRYKYYLSGFT